MKVLILAAGRGTRISRYLSGKPKCTVDIGGGQCLVDGGEVIECVEYPICGLLSDLSCEELAARKSALNAACAERGCIISIPFMFLSFICLAALPAYAITDHGFINVMTLQIEDPIKGVME